MKKLTRRQSLAVLGGAAAAPSLIPTVSAHAALPEGNIRLLVGFPAGGGTDVMGRLIAEALKQRTGRTVIVENKAGASGTIAAADVKNSPPDGRTIIYIPSASIVQKLTMADVPFDPRKDFAPLTLAGTVQTAFCVSSTLGVNTFAEYLTWLKANPSKAKFGTTAMGSFTHFFGVMIGQEIGIPLEPIAYRGAAPLMTDLYGGHVPAGCGGITDFLEHHRGGKLKVLLTSGLSRVQAAPELPTATELGYPKLNILGWYVFLAAAKTPAPIVEAWNRELTAVLQMPDIKKRLVEFGLDVETSTPQQFSERLDNDLAKWQRILDSIGWKPA